MCCVANDRASANCTPRRSIFNTSRCSQPLPVTALVALTLTCSRIPAYVGCKVLSADSAKTNISRQHEKHSPCVITCTVICVYCNTGLMTSCRQVYGNATLIDKCTLKTNLWSFVRSLLPRDWANTRRTGCRAVPCVYCESCSSYMITTFVNHLFFTSSRPANCPVRSYGLKGQQHWYVRSQSASLADRDF